MYVPRYTLTEEKTIRFFFETQYVVVLLVFYLWSHYHPNIYAL